MGTTDRFGLRYPALTDEPNGPGQMQVLAEDTDKVLGRALPVADAAARTALGATLAAAAEGFLVRQSDTGDVWIWTGAAWSQIGGTTSGAGTGGAAGAATYRATATQSIGSGGAATTVAFGDALTADPLVTRAPDGAGHKFTLGQTGLWIISATIRFSSTSSSAERTFELRAGASTILAKAGGPGNGVPFTANLAAARVLAAGTAVKATAYQETGSSLALEPQAGDWVHIDLACVA